MKYVARISKDIEWDIKRDFSTWGDFTLRETDETIVENYDADLLDDDTLTEKQQRWIALYGDQYKDYDLFRSTFIEEKAREIVARTNASGKEFVRDERYGTWGIKHHDGLSCWYLGDTLPEALNVLNKNLLNLDATWAEATVGKTRRVMSIQYRGWELHILECEDVVEETSDPYAIEA